MANFRRRIALEASSTQSLERCRCALANSERMSNLIFKKATDSDSQVIWEILQDAIAQRKSEGSDQWQNGYPNPESVAEDIAAQCGYLIIEDDVPVAYAAIVFEDEPAYAEIDGAWLTFGKYAVVHRVARSAKARTRGISYKVFELAEELCATNGVGSIRVDTNFDNLPMLKVLEKLGYTYCGEIFFQGAPRRAYEKIVGDS